MLVVPVISDSFPLSNLTQYYMRFHRWRECAVRRGPAGIYLALGTNFYHRQDATESKSETRNPK